LCFLSSPGYDPNLLVGQVRSKNFRLLNEDPVKPLLNRAIAGQYTPGSTFKMANDMIGLEEGVITDQTRFSCQGPGSSPIRCTHNHQTPLDVYTAIQQSCNPFHFQVFRAIMLNQKYGTVKERYDAWRNHLLSMGFGRSLNSDLPYELKGVLYPSSYFDRIYGAGRWNYMTIRSLSIGQGEIDATPIQMANYSAMVANRGWYYVPHLVRAIGNERNKTHFTDKKSIVTISTQNVSIVRKGMEEVVESGTGRSVKIDSITMAGKTGTADNPHGKPHSFFVAFAPVENPKIAICVIVENAGFGATWAAPIASLMVEKYISRNVKRKDLEDRMKNTIIYYPEQKN
jgi:penicillin-binding protein 2